MRSGSEKIRGSRWCGGCVCAPNLRVGRPDLTRRSCQPANNEWHSDAEALCPIVMVCAILPATAIYSFIDTFLVFPNTFLLYRWIHPSAVLVCFGVYPLIAILLYWLCAIFSHIGTNPHVFHTSRVYFAANILFSFLLSSLASGVKTFIMFSLYLFLKVDYRHNQTCDLHRN